MAGEFLHDPTFHHSSNQVIGRRVSCTNETLDILYRNDGVLVEVLQHEIAVSCRAAKARGYQIAMLFAEIKDSACGVGCLLAHLNDTTQEKDQPLLPVAGVAYRLQCLVILLAVLFEKMRKIQRGLE